MTEFTSDFKMLVEDAKGKIDEHVKATKKHLASIVMPYLTQARPSTNTYTLGLINPPIK
jgi:hypothetical protein